MPLSRFRRWSFLFLCVLLSFIWCRGREGLFSAAAPPGWGYFLFREVRTEGVLLSGFERKRPGERAWVRLESAEGRTLKPVTAMLYLRRGGDGGPGRLPYPGERAAFTGRLRRPLWPRNPGGFDEGAFLDRHGAALVLHARTASVLPGAPSSGPPVWGARIRRSAHAHFNERFPPAEAAVLEGLLLGFSGGLPARDKRAVQDAGIMHLLTPSGAKVTLVCGAALWLSSILLLPPWARAGAVLAAGAAFLLVAGAAAPHARAYLMCAACSAGFLLGRGVDPFGAWTLSAVVLLLSDPPALFSAGFVLTYAAFLGLLLAFPGRRGGAGAFPGWKISLVIQLVLLPPLAAYFGIVSLAGVLVNLLWVPLSGPLSVLAAAGWAADAAGAETLCLALARAAGWAASLFLATCRTVGRMDWAAMDARGLDGWLIAAYYAGLLGLLRWPDRATVSFCAAVCALLLVSRAFLRPPAPILETVVLSPPEAAGVFLRVRGGGEMIWDGRMAPGVERTVRRTLGWDPAGLSRARGPAEARAGGLSLAWDGGQAVLSSGGKVEYCIMASSASRRRLCPYERTYDARREGAVRIVARESEIEIETQKERYTQGRVVSQRGQAGSGPGA